MKRYRLCAFALAAATAVLSGCSGIDSPGLPKSILDSPIDLKFPLVMGINRLHGLRVRGSIIVGPLAKNTPLPWFDDCYTDEISLFTSEVNKIHLTVEGQSVAFSEQAIGSLIDPHWYQIKRNGTQTYLVIDGLDAAASYRAVFTIENGSVQQRLIAQGEFGHETWERTIYHDDFILHPDRYKNM
jgi:hypothetical protein